MTTGEETSGLVALLSDPLAWYTLALVVFLLVFNKVGTKPLLGWLDSEIEKVREELTRASGLRRDAEIALKEYDERHRAALKEAESIIAHARAEADQMRRAAETALADSLRRQEEQALQRLRLAENEARAEIRAALIAQAVRVAREQLGAQADTATLQSLADRALEEVPESLEESGKAA